MATLPHLRNSARLTLLSLLSVATSVVLTGIVPAPPGTGTGAVLLLALVLTDLLYEYSPDTPDSGDDQQQPPAGPEPDLDTDSLIIDAWRGDQ